MSSFQKHRTHQLDLRDMLLKAGVGQFNAIMSIPYMNFLPGTTEPYAQGVLQLVAGLQRLLNAKGAHLICDGGLGADTVREIIPWSGPRWMDKSWAQIYRDVLEGEPWPGYRREDRGPRLPAPAVAALSGDRWNYRFPELSGAIGDMIDSPLVLVAAGAFVWWKFFRKGGTES